MKPDKRLANIEVNLAGQHQETVWEPRATIFHTNPVNLGVSMPCLVAMWFIMESKRMVKQGKTWRKSLSVLMISGTFSKIGETTRLLTR